MKILRKIIGIVLLTVFLMTVFSFWCYGVNKDENYELLLEYGFTSDYLDNLSDVFIEKMADTIRETSGEKQANDYYYLLSCGYPKAFLELLTDSTLKNIVSSIGDNEIISVTYTNKDPAFNMSDNSKVVIKRVSVKMKDKKSDKIVGEAVCVYWEWLDNKPLMREEDFVAVKWNSELFTYNPDSFYAEDYWKENTTDKWTVADSYTVLTRATQEAIGHWTKLKSSGNIVGGAMIFSLLSKSEIDKKTDYTNKITVEYTHQYRLTKFIIIVVILVVILLTAVIIVLSKKHRRKIQKTTESLKNKD